MSSHETELALIFTLTLNPLILLCPKLCCSTWTRWKVSSYSDVVLQTAQGRPTRTPSDNNQAFRVAGNLLQKRDVVRGRETELALWLAVRNFQLSRDVWIWELCWSIA